MAGRWGQSLAEQQDIVKIFSGTVRYIHKNPLRANIVNNIREYPWSSHHGISPMQKSGIGCISVFCLECFQTGRLLPEILSFFGKKNLASLFGSVDFIQWIKEKYYLSMYLGRKLAGLSLAELGIAFDSKKYSSVGSVVL